MDERDAQEEQPSKNDGDDNDDEQPTERDNDDEQPTERFPPFASWPPYLIDPSCCSAPYPRTGAAEGSHIRGDCTVPVEESDCRSQEQPPLDPTRTHEPGPGET